MTKTPRITYLVANSLDESNTILGYTYTIMRSELKYAEFILNPSILVSCREGHTNPFYPVGYLIIDHAIKSSGFAKAARLLGYSDLDAMFKHEFGYHDKKAIHMFISHLLDRYEFGGKI